ncbi:Glycosyl transferases group 1 [compost metagenome]
MFRSIIKKLYLLLFDRDYVMKNSTNKWVFISYLSEPLYKIGDDVYFNRHQNRREAIVIAESFYKKGFNVHIRRFDKPIIFTKRKYDIIFGLEPNFVYMSSRNEDALKIYYATGAYWEFQNSQIKNRTIEASKRFGHEFKLNRLVAPHNSPIIADHIMQIGTLNTVQTYPEQLRGKISLLRQSLTVSSDLYKENNKAERAKRSTFLWFGSKGSILKGLDLILPIFKTQTNFVLHIVGNMDDDFEEIYKREFLANNIFYHGFLDITDPNFLAIAEQCTFTIFPSCSEGGTPGSLLNTMYLGLIPITTAICASPQMYELGEIVALNKKSIEDGIKKLQQLSDADLQLLALKNHNYIKDNYNLEIFQSDFCSNLTNLLVKNKYISH